MAVPVPVASVSGFGRWLIPIAVLSATFLLALDYRTNPPSLNILVLVVGVLVAMASAAAMFLWTANRMRCPSCSSRVSTSFNLCPRCGVRLR